MAALEELYPSRPPQLETPDRKIWWDAGARSVVELLRVRLKEQQDDLLNEGLPNL